MAVISSIENETISGFTIGEGTVTLYDLAGEPLAVSTDKVQYWLDKGFRKTQLDLNDSYSTFMAYLDATAQTVKDFYNGVVKDQFIDTSDNASKAAAERAMSLLIESWNRMTTDISLLFQVRQGESIVLRNIAGEEIAVDPGQVEKFNAEGWN